MADREQAQRALAEWHAITSMAEALDARPDMAATAARERVTEIRRRVARDQIRRIPIARLRETAKGLRLDALERASYDTVADIVGATERQLCAVPGVGEATARQALGAARQVLAATEEVVRLHFDVVARPPEYTELIRALRCYDLARRAADEAQPVIDWLKDMATPLAVAAEPATKSRIRRIFTSAAAKQAADAAVDRLLAAVASPELQHFRDRADIALAATHARLSDDDAWADYEHNAAQLLGILGEITGGASSAATRGHLPAEIVERVQSLPLDQTFLKASLRGYQAFGAKFALVQGRTILGDEMGLGKTVEALAVLCHLRANGDDTALVVCPASVVANWRTEIHRHTQLTAHVIHGPDRQVAYRQWTRHGGVAITTFDGLRRLSPPDGADAHPVAMLVVDEAHYAKNPATKRSQAVANWGRHAKRVLFLTGTPMENRVEEFRALVEHLQPHVAERVDAANAVAGAAAFQAAVAPAYLRRNQADVLDELPDLISALDWVDPTPADLDAYRRAVASQSFMAMRRAAFLGATNDDRVPTAADPARSAKLDRLLDIVDEATKEGLKVVVFSYFRDVLHLVARAVANTLPGATYGPLTGSTPIHERQRLVEQLAAQPGGAVLVSQIEAGGVGMNIQAASVVVLCEPQWKPTTEAQAIARCHRMGQVRRVQVHRLLLEDTVDQRMLAILAGKQHLIERFVRGSAIKDATPDAIDISDLDKVKAVTSEAHAEALIIASERRRLGLDVEDTPPPIDAVP